MRERSVNVAIVGNCYYDEIWRVFEYPRSGGKISADSIQKGLGGSATNTAVALRRLEYQPHLFSIIGEDSIAHILVKHLEDYDLSDENIIRVEGETGRTIILLQKDGTTTKIGYPGVSRLIAERLRMKIITDPKKFEHVHFASVALDVMEQFLEHKHPMQSCSFDVGAALLESDKSEVLEVLSQFNLGFMNRLSFSTLYGEGGLENLLTANTPENIVITMDAKGVYAKFDEEIYQVPAFKTDPIDSTGAGDAVAAYCIGKWLEGHAPGNFLEEANLYASLKVRKIGGAKGQADLSDFTQALEERKASTNT